MSTLMESLGIHRLSIEEKLQLVGEIWDSIAASPEQLPLTEAQKQELDRRIAAHEAHPERAIPWEEVKARAQARLRQ